MGNCYLLIIHDQVAEVEFVTKAIILTLCPYTAIPSLFHQAENTFQHWATTMNERTRIPPLNGKKW